MTSFVGLSAFVASCLVGAVASAGLIDVRLAHGQSESPVLWIFMAMGSLLLARASIPQARGRSVAELRLARRQVLVAQGVGAASGVLVAHHLLLGSQALGGAGAVLVEGPAQMVNDAAFVLGLLALVWSFAATTEVRRLLTALFVAVVVVSYWVTAPMWHFDRFPGLPVQHYVVSQTMALAAGLLVFDVVAPLISDA